MADETEQEMMKALAIIIGAAKAFTNLPDLPNEAAKEVRDAIARFTGE